jgi:transcriptional/translational regulatory protein YebC/TACO1
VGSVAHLFQRRGQIFVDADGVDEDRLMEVALEAGADDMQRDGDSFEILTPPTDFMKVSDAVTAAGFTVGSAELTFLADTEVPVTKAAQAKSLMRFLEALDDLDDVQNVYSNADIDDALLDDAE